MTPTPTAAVAILVVDDEPDLRTLYEITLQRCGYEVYSAADLEQAHALLQRRRFAVLVTDMRLPDGQGLELIEWLQQNQRAERGIVVTAYRSADNAVRALKAGAFDYLTKPVNLDQFRHVVAQAVRAGGNMAETEPASEPPANSPHKKPTSVSPAATNTPATSAPAALSSLVGAGTQMQQLKATLHKVASSMAPVLVWGESGSGKELVARALHACSHRSDGPFVAVNCGAIPENLLEAEFFGSKKGAYTGSVADREGLFQSASKGTLFLDEIGDLPLSMQAKLLRVIQERQVRPLGAAQEIAVDVRIVSATHRNLAEMVQTGQFRHDLFYRLNVIDVHVPPLRERREDIPALALALLHKIASDDSHAVPAMTPAFLQRLQDLPLPGNVRELENTLHRCWALSNGKTLDADLLSDTPDLVAVAPSAAEQSAAPAATTLPLQAEEEQLPCDLEAFLNAHEKALLLRALQRTQFNRTAAAGLLGLNLRQIRYRMERLGIGSAENEHP
jgi:two-component system response regulator PilR (NtrC family)